MDENTPPQRFWQRQFGPVATPDQMAFDIAFGIIFPILSLAFDPIVFRGDFAFLARHRIFAYVAIALGIATLTVWFLLKSRLSRWSGFFAGVFFSGEVLALLLGLALLPLSLPGLLVLIGIFGFAPFMTSFVFYRNSTRARRLARESVSRPWRAGSFLLGILLVITIPIATQAFTDRFVSQAVDEVLRGSPQMMDDAILRLRSAFWCTETCYTDIVFAYERETDPWRRSILARAYEEITGQDIEHALQTHMD
jgi:hypothetical protein